METVSSGLGFRPLYKQVRDHLVRRLVERVWPPGHPLPSEIELAAELGVSQGTVRKALDEMAQENLVVRRQGRGTFVAEHDEERILFQFFKLMPDAGEISFPESQVLDVTVRDADAAETARLQLPDAPTRIVSIRRLRSLRDTPVIIETIRVPSDQFPGLARGDIPNNLYGLYATRFGITIAHAEERLKAVSLTAEEARILGVATATPTLLVDRTAFSLERRPVEWRLSLCLTDAYHYRSDLR